MKKNKHNTGKNQATITVLIVLEITINSHKYQKIKPKNKDSREQTDKGGKLNVEGGDGSGEFHIFIASTLTADPACPVGVAKLPRKTHFVVGMTKKKNSRQPQTLKSKDGNACEE